MSKQLTGVGWKIPEDVLDRFKAYCDKTGSGYQDTIAAAMIAYEYLVPDQQRDAQLVAKGEQSECNTLNDIKPSNKLWISLPADHQVELRDEKSSGAAYLRLMRSMYDDWAAEGSKARKSQKQRLRG